MLPIVEPFLAGLAALAAMVGFRFIVADKDRRLLQNSFALYLAPHVIDRMLSSNKLPELGGETRHVTVFFSDIEGFSRIAEKMSPDSLMSLMNEYLSEMTDIIEAMMDMSTNISAIPSSPCSGRRPTIPIMPPTPRARRWIAARGLPTSTAHRPLSATAGCRNASGINSGEALVGNFGSRRRFNYSVMSDAVNVASRLEGANKFYGTTIIASEATVALAGEPSPGASSMRSASRGAARR